MFANTLRTSHKLLMLIVAGAAVAPLSLVAQQPLAQQVTAVAPVATTASFIPPSSPTSSVLFSAPSSERVLTESVAVAVRGERPRAGRDVAFMIVGGAALVTGIVVGGDGGLIISTGGVVIGLLGLYRYLR